MVNSNDSSLHADITLNDNKLEEVNKFSHDTTIYYMEQPIHSFYAKIQFIPFTCIFYINLWM